jgi:uncharacterized membrane protein
MNHVTSLKIVIFKWVFSCWDSQALIIITFVLFVFIISIYQQQFENRIKKQINNQKFWIHNTITKKPSKPPK